MTDKPVTLAAIIGAHGVTGEVRLKLFGEGWETLKAHAAFNDGAIRLEKVRSDMKGGAVARLAGVADRNVRSLRGTVLTVRVRPCRRWMRASLPFRPCWNCRSSPTPARL
jgi:16S rRNA processing protein RimM